MRRIKGSGLERVLVVGRKKSQLYYHFSVADSPPSTVIVILSSVREKLSSKEHEQLPEERALRQFLKYQSQQGSWPRAVAAHRIASHLS